MGRRPVMLVSSTDSSFTAPMKALIEIIVTLSVSMDVSLFPPEHIIYRIMIFSLHGGTYHFILEGDS